MSIISLSLSFLTYQHKAPVRLCVQDYPSHNSPAVYAAPESKSRYHSTVIPFYPNINVHNFLTHQQQSPHHILPPSSSSNHYESSRHNSRPYSVHYQGKLTFSPCINHPCLFNHNNTTIITTNKQMNPSIDAQSITRLRRFFLCWRASQDSLSDVSYHTGGEIGSYGEDVGGLGNVRVFGLRS